MKAIYYMMAYPRISFWVVYLLSLAILTLSLHVGYFAIVLVPIGLFGLYKAIVITFVDFLLWMDKIARKNTDYD